MKLTIDIGGTKVLVAVFENDKVINQYKFETPKNYLDFLEEFKKSLVNLNDYHIEIAAVAIPELINRETFELLGGGNLKWQKVNIVNDLASILNCNVLLENDANLAGLSEASYLKDRFNRVLYLTISTGIGGGLVVNQKLSPDNLNFEPGLIKLKHNNQLIEWEKFASGRAIVGQYHQFAKDINDPVIWQEIANNILDGLMVIIPLIQPQAIVFGGSVGTYFDKYQEFLEHGLDQVIEPFLLKPVILQAIHPEEAVVYGCLELINQV